MENIPFSNSVKIDQFLHWAIAANLVKNKIGKENVVIHYGVKILKLINCKTEKEYKIIHYTFSCVDIFLDLVTKKIVCIKKALPLSLIISLVYPSYNLG